MIYCAEKFLEVIGALAVLIVLFILILFALFVYGETKYRRSTSMKNKLDLAPLQKRTRFSWFHPFKIILCLLLLAQSALGYTAKSNADIDVLVTAGYSGLSAQRCKELGNTVKSCPPGNYDALYNNFQSNAPTAEKNFVATLFTADPSSTPTPTPADWVRTIYRDLGLVASDNIDNRLIGKSSSDEAIFSTRDNSTPTYVRSATSWCHDIDLTSVSVWNSETGGTPANSLKTVTLVAPDVGITAHHFLTTAGKQFRFVTNAGAIVTLTVGSTANVTGDIDVVKFTSAAPATITPMKVFTALQLSKLATNTPIAFLDQNLNAYIGDRIDTIASAINLGTPGESNRAAFWATVTGGDSSHPMFAIIDGQPILLATLEAITYAGSLAAQYDLINTAIATTGSTYQLTPFLAPANGTAANFNAPANGDAAAGEMVKGNDSRLPKLAPTSVKTTTYTAVPFNFVPVDTSGGNVTINLTSSAADKDVIAVKMVIQGGTNTVTINAGGSAVFNKASGSTSLTLTTLNQGVILQFHGLTSPGIWYVVADDLALSQLDARYLGASAVPITAYDSTNAPDFAIFSGAVTNVSMIAAGPVNLFTVRTGKNFVCTSAYAIVTSVTGPAGNAPKFQLIESGSSGALTQQSAAQAGVPPAIGAIYAPLTTNAINVTGHFAASGTNVQASVPTVSTSTDCKATIFYSGFYYTP